MFVYEHFFPRPSNMYDFKFYELNKNQSWLPRDFCVELSEFVNEKNDFLKWNCIASIITTKYGTMNAKEDNFVFFYHVLHQCNKMNYFGLFSETVSGAIRETIKSISANLN